MAELFVQISESLDGFIDDRNGDLQRFTEDTSLDELATETLRSIDGMIFGRKARAARPVLADGGQRRGCVDSPRGAGGAPVWVRRRDPVDPVPRDPRRRNPTIRERREAA
jgi:hypothetical protein